MACCKWRGPVKGGQRVLQSPSTMPATQGHSRHLNGNSLPRTCSVAAQHGAATEKRGPHVRHCRLHRRRVAAVDVGDRFVQPGACRGGRGWIASMQVTGGELERAVDAGDGFVRLAPAGRSDWCSRRDSCTTRNKRPSTNMPAR